LVDLRAAFLTACKLFENEWGKGWKKDCEEKAGESQKKGPKLYEDHQRKPTEEVRKKFRKKSRLGAISRQKRGANFASRSNLDPSKGNK